MNVAWVLAALLVCLGCAKRPSETPLGTAVEIHAPLGLPPVPIPNDNPPTVETVALGRKLFYDVRLSADGTVACASCHNPAHGFSDGRGHSIGVGGKTGTRNAPTVLNAAYQPLQFWDGRARSLEQQAEGPIANPVEMNLPHDLCVARLGADAEYRAAFQKAFGAGPVTLVRLEKAIASFERTLLSGNSPFDRYRYAGDTGALSAGALRGLAVFTDPERGNCAVCPPIGDQHALFTEGGFHNPGAGVDGAGEITDQGRYSETKAENDRGSFKTPCLRNVSETAPYMHDGSLRTLKQMVDFYAGGGNSNPYLDPEIKKIRLTGRDRGDLVEFLGSLTGERPAGTGPPK
ncbi:MAG: cytochrome-c peroxidase [Acidobacteria bacterium]|nr:cytochrome-c peroxidase [Acidobacteriota bacterium]